MHIKGWNRVVYLFPNIVTKNEDVKGYSTPGPYFWRLCAFSQKTNKQKTNKQLLTKYSMDLVRNMPKNSSDQIKETDFLDKIATLIGVKVGNVTMPKVKCQWSFWYKFWQLVPRRTTGSKLSKWLLATSLHWRNM